MITFRRLVRTLLLCLAFGTTNAFVPWAPTLGTGAAHSRQSFPSPQDTVCLWGTPPVSVEQELEETTSLLDLERYPETAALNEAIHFMCRNGEVDDALNVIHLVEESMDQGDGLKPDQYTYVCVINELGRSNDAERAEELLRHMSSLSKEHPCCTPKGQAYSAVILAWSNSRNPKASQRADALLAELWSRFNSTQDKAFIPTRATYTSTITAWARCARSKDAAERAEELLEEMEAYRNLYPMLGPTTACVNAVLNAWSKSGDKGAAARSEVILKRMEGLALEGRTEMQPDTVSFNTVIDTLARSGLRDAQRRAEFLLQRMDDLSKGDAPFPCEPDTLSFNIVINSWNKSKEQGAARRAEAILRHMEKRHEMRSSHVVPDVSTYNSVIHAWSRSRESEAPQRADAVLRRMESAYENGNMSARPDSTTYNSLINVWAKSKDPLAGDRALEILALMKTLETGLETPDCRPDAFTYTSVIDTLAKQGTPEAADRAVTLLNEMEEAYKRTRDECIKPNVRTYTSAINAIARSRRNPERAESILDRLESNFETGELDVQPDVVCYNAVINAWGWSAEKGKSRRAQKLYRRMLDAYESGKNPHVKPDIVTCNSLLNACAFETADSDAERATTVEIAIECLEAFQAAAPKYGWPNHITFGNMLLAIGRQMPISEKRLDLAEATFWQCCKAGHVSTLVISNLRNAVDEDRLKSIMGSALFVNRGNAFSYDMRRLPREWRRYAPQPRETREGHNQQRAKAASRKSAGAVR